MLKWNIISLLFVLAGYTKSQTSVTGCYLSGGMTNGKTAGCGNGATPCNMAATSYSYFGAFCGSATSGGTASWVSVSTNFALPAGCTATVEAEMKPRTNIHATGCNNSGADGSDYVSITSSGGTIVSESATICCSTASCTAYPTLPGTITNASASGFTTGCANSTMKSQMVVTGGTITILGRSDRADEVTTYTINLSGTCGTNCDGVLPIQLKEFYADAEPDHIKLFWDVAHEENVEYYVVEKSADGELFFPVATVPSIADQAGSVNLKYSATDNTPYRSINYYRLINYDKDGSYQTSKILAVPFGSSIGSEIQIAYTTDHVLIQTEGIARSRDLQVIDLAGRVIMQLNNSGNNKFSVSRGLVAKGIYFIKVDGVTLPAQKMLIQ